MSDILVGMGDGYLVIPEPCDYCDEVHEQPEQFCCVCGNELPPTYSAGRHAHGCYKTMEYGGEDHG